MSGFLQVKIEKNLSLEMQIDELRDSYLSLEQNLSGGDMGYKQKTHMLERGNIELNEMYQGAMNA